jgi:hypothetical protein
MQTCLMTMCCHNIIIILDIVQSSDDGHCPNNYHVYNKPKHVIKITGISKTIWIAHILTHDKLWISMWHFFFISDSPQDQVETTGEYWMRAQPQKYTAMSFLLLYWGKTMSLRNCGHYPIVHPPDDTWVNMEQCWNNTDRENWRT